MMNVAIIGAGLMGYRRAQVLRKFSDCKLIVVVDTSVSVAKNISDKFGGEIETDWKKVVGRKDVDIIVVSTYNKFLSPICVCALKNKKHVLCEKPLGRDLEESIDVIKAAFTHRAILKVGFNHRYHPAVSKAKELFDEGRIGDLFFLRCRYGYGGRPGFDKEWRTNKDLSGGGELLDQGSHVVDLFRWFGGNFNTVSGYIKTYLWGDEVEDNAFAVFRKYDGVLASMHVSSTQWKNLFSFEVFGKKGYLIVEGLGGWYGVETLKIGERRQDGDPPNEQIIEFPGEDVSLEKEWGHFLNIIKTGKLKHSGDGVDGYQASVMIDGIYKSAKIHKEVEL